MTSSLPPPFAVQGTAFFVVAVSILMIACHGMLLVSAGARTALSARMRAVLPGTVALVLTVWLAWAILAVPEWVQIPEPAPDAGRAVQRPELLLAMAGFVGVGIVALFASKSLRVINTAMPPWWLIAVQFYRVAGFLFLWPMWSSGALSGAFALPAGIGDTLTGLAAPFVAWAVARRKRGSHALAVAWNWFGILDLIVAPVAAVLAQSTNIGYFPLVVVPLFLGPPLGILTHVYSLRNLRAHRINQANEAKINASTASAVS